MTAFESRYIIHRVVVQMYGHGTALLVFLVNVRQKFWWPASR